MERGRFITFEGGEGSGKSTQVKRLAERLRAAGLSVVETREPGGSPFAEKLRSVILDPACEPHAPLSEALLFYAARADHLQTVIRPALAAGQWVLCDRFSDSTRVYQGYAGTLALKILDALDLLVVVPTRPDLTLVIDVPVDIGLSRAALRAQSATRGRDATGAASGKSQPRTTRSLLADRYESRDIEFHHRLRAGFQKLAEGEPRRCVLIDGEKDAEEVSGAVWDAVRQRLMKQQA